MFPVLISARRNMSAPADDSAKTTLATDQVHHEASHLGDTSESGGSLCLAQANTCGCLGEELGKLLDEIIDYRPGPSHSRVYENR